MTAQWWVRYTDKRRPWMGQATLSLSSPDNGDTGAAARRAAATARARLIKKGIQPLIHAVRCVG